MTEDLLAEITSIRSVHTRLEHRIAKLEQTSSGERKSAPDPVETPAPQPHPIRAQRDQSASKPPEPRSTPKPPPAKTPPAPRRDTELRIGRFWLVRIGIVILLTGLIFLGNYAYHEFVTNLGPTGKLTLLTLAAAALATIGHLARRRRSLANYGRVLIGGGIATGYYAAYAAHFVEPLRVITSPLVGGTLLLAAAAAILWLADRLRSQAIAALTISLAFYTGAINPVTQFSLTSNVLLALVAVVLLLRNHWTALTLVSLLGTYGAFAFWRIVNTGSLFVIHAPTDAVFLTAIAFPACYWLVFTAATLLGRDRAFPSYTRSTFLTVNNAAFYALIAPVIAGTHPDALGWATGTFGIVLISLAFFTPANAASTYLTQGLGLLSAGLLLEFTGYQRALIFAFQSATLLTLSRGRHGRILQIFSGLAALIATAVASERLFAEASHAPLVAFAVAAVLASNAFLFKFQRRLLHPLTLSYRAGGYLALATTLTLTAIVHTTTGDSRLALLLTLGLAATFTTRITRLPELGLCGQLLAAAGQLTWFLQPPHHFTHALPLLLTLTAGAALIHWWQHQNILPANTQSRITAQALHTLLPTGILATWAFHLDGPLAPEILFALLGLAILTYGFATRAWTLTFASGLFTTLAIRAASIGIFQAESWTEPVIATALIGSQSLLLSALGHRAPARSSRVLRQICQLLRAITLGLATAITLAFAPTQWHPVILALSALSLFSLAAWTKNREPLIQSTVLAILALGPLAHGMSHGDTVFLPNLIVFATAAVAQRLANRTGILPTSAQATLIVTAVLGTWLIGGRAVADATGGLLITASWSALAAAALTLGFLWHERTYRHAGLGILLVTLTRLVLVDVWQFGTLTRILSFITLGAVLLVIGFFYNAKGKSVPPESD